MLSQTPYNPISYNMYTPLHGYQADGPQYIQTSEQQQQQPQQQQIQIPYQPPHQRQHQFQPSNHYQQTANYVSQYQSIPYYRPVASQNPQYQDLNRSDTPNSIPSNDYNASSTAPLTYSPQSTVSFEISALPSAESSITQTLDTSDSAIIQENQPNLSSDESLLLNSNLRINSRSFKSRSAESFTKVTKQQTQAQEAASRQKLVKKSNSTLDSVLEPKPLSDTYIPSDPSLDISFFTEEDVIILKNMLPAAEIQKWKYASQRLSKIRSKKLNAEFCISKFHAMFGLPFNPKKSLLQSIYSMKADSKNTSNLTEENFEGILGSSIPYIVAKDGWNSIDP